MSFLFKKIFTKNPFSIFFKKISFYSIIHPRKSPVFIGMAVFIGKGK
jgi:hypothetical protein